MKRATFSLPLLAMLCLGISSCAFGDRDALEQHTESGETAFVAAGVNSSIYTSKDGIVWTGPHLMIAGNDLNASVHTPWGFFAAGGDGSYTNVVYSQDGYSWLSLTTNFINPTFTFVTEDCIYADGALLIAHHEGILRSYDGST
ncbi:MAG: hypothetical protein JXA20_17835 [Spirochaetes bacterium]|nr:hypothetical protein [Spirochaetota bacterium]